MTSDISERGLEDIIIDRLTGQAHTGRGVGEGGASYDTRLWVPGAPADYDRQNGIDLPKLVAFLTATQPMVVEKLALTSDGPSRTQFLERLRGEIAKRGVVDVLRRGVKHQAFDVQLFFGRPTPGNATAAANYAANVFSVTRQLRYSLDDTANALDLALFVNGLPVITLELKNSLSGQTVANAVRQYQNDRNPNELLFQPGRCAVHFAVDDAEVRFCAGLVGKDSRFFPFNRGADGGAGNPPNPRGLKTAYLWVEVLAPDSLVDIIENFAHTIEVPGPRGRKHQLAIWPRYHQLEAVRRLLADAAASGVGKRYLIQHSAGSGKSNSIAWLAHQLIDLRNGDRPLFDTVIVVTDRRVLDQQIKETIKSFAQSASTVGNADRSSDLVEFINQGKRIIVSTVQKFPHILDQIGDAHRDRTFAIIIDEAHSSQGGKTSTAISQALGAEPADDDDETLEDEINRIIASRKLLTNASYFAFTATPKAKTLEIFGTPTGEADLRGPFHAYTMKQAIEEGFILDVLASYTPVRSYYRLVKTMENDPEFDLRQANRVLRRYVENSETSIQAKAAIVADHFATNVYGARKINGQARAMVVAEGVERAIKWWKALNTILKKTKAPYSALIAFSGERKVDGLDVTEADLNGFPSSEIPSRFRDGDYRFLVVADKFQTGYDEPLLHSMYVDRALSGVKAVQTLSRLNRAHRAKHDTMVLDFANDADEIARAFAPYYETTLLAGETDPNKLNDLADRLNQADVYSQSQVDDVVKAFLGGASREDLDPILDVCVPNYLALDEQGQVEFKGGAKSFSRTYNYLAAILPYGRPDWERLSIFLNLLIPKLPAPIIERIRIQDLLESVDLESYRAEVQSTTAAADLRTVPITPPPPSTGNSMVNLERLPLSEIVAQFNAMFGNVTWQDADRVRQVVTVDLPAMVAQDEAYKNAMSHSDEANARFEHDRVLQRIIADMVVDQSELYKQFTSNPDFKRWLANTVFNRTYRPGT